MESSEFLVGKEVYLLLEDFHKGAITINHMGPFLVIKTEVVPGHGGFLELDKFPGKGYPAHHFMYGPQRCSDFFD